MTREQLIAWQKKAIDLEFQANVLVQEIGLALDRLDAEQAKKEPLCDACLRRKAVEEGSYGTRYCVPCWKRVTSERC